MPGTGATLDPEWSVLLTACSTLPQTEKLTRLREMLRPTLHWQSLFDLADKHGVQPLLYESLKNLEEVVPADEMRRQSQSYQTNLHKALLISRELIRIIECLSAAGIEVIPYKGVALAEAVYGDLALRQAGDIDLFARPQDFSRTRDAVRELGYTPHLSLSPAQERAYLKSGYECAFDGTAGRNLLEVQWAIQPRFYAVDFDMNGLFQRAITIQVAGRPMKTPSLEDLFVVLSVHAAKHVWGRLVWLCDIAQLMSAPTLDWNSIGLQARELGIVRMLRVCMLAANHLLGAAIPTAAEIALPEDSESSALADEIQKHIAGQSTLGLQSAAYFRLMLCLRERQLDRLRFLQRLAFTPGLSEWQAVRLPAALFPLYRLVRLSRLAARLVRT